MPKEKYPMPLSFALSRQTVSILDDVAEDLGIGSRRAAIELLARYVKRLHDTNGTTYTSLLISSEPQELEARV